jgi:hypothetical protein
VDVDVGEHVAVGADVDAVEDVGLGLELDVVEVMPCTLAHTRLN